MPIDPFSLSIFKFCKWIVFCGRFCRDYNSSHFYITFEHDSRETIILETPYMIFLEDLLNVNTSLVFCYVASSDLMKFLITLIIYIYDQEILMYT